MGTQKWRQPAPSRCTSPAAIAVLSAARRSVGRERRGGAPIHEILIPVWLTARAQPVETLSPGLGLAVPGYLTLRHRVWGPLCRGDGELTQICAASLMRTSRDPHGSHIGPMSFSSPPDARGRVSRLIAPTHSCEAFAVLNSPRNCQPAARLGARPCDHISSVLLTAHQALLG